MKKAAKSKAVLLPFEDGKPLRRMSSYQTLEGKKNGGDADTYKLHALLGPYPAELEFVYPFTQTVTDEQPGDEEVMAAVSRLKKMGYRSVRVERTPRRGRVRR